jgi:hypothetical protein
VMQLALFLCDNNKVSQVLTRNKRMIRGNLFNLDKVVPRRSSTLEVAVTGTGTVLRKNSSSQPKAGGRVL